MKIFLSVAGPDRGRAVDVALTLRGEGHQVFLDEHSLPPGGAFHRRIREAIAQADLIVFFVSRTSLEADRYTLTELKFIQDRFPHPQGRVLPTIVNPEEFASLDAVHRIPPYLRAVTLCKPVGNLAAEVAFEVSRMASELERNAPRDATFAIPGFAGTTSDTVQVKLVEGAVAGIGFGAVAVVLSLLAHEFDGKLHTMWLKESTYATAYIVGHGLSIALPILLSALLFNLRNLFGYVALVTGCMAAVIFERQFFDALQDQPIALQVGKSFVFAACAALALPAFRTFQAFLLVLAFGALAGQLIEMYGRGVSGFVWEALVTSVATFILAWNAFFEQRMGRLAAKPG